eukprot:644759-Pleurochrysis_carterae.AAC.1
MSRHGAHTATFHVSHPAIRCIQRRDEARMRSAMLAGERTCAPALGMPSRLKANALRFLRLVI